MNFSQSVKYCSLHLLKKTINSGTFQWIKDIYSSWFCVLKVEAAPWGRQDMQNDSWWSRRKLQMVWPFMVHFSKIKLLYFPRFICKQVSHQHPEFCFFLEKLEKPWCTFHMSILTRLEKELLPFYWASDLQSPLCLMVLHLGRFTHFHCPAGSYSHSDLQLGLKTEINIRLSKTVENYLTLLYENYRKQYLWEKSVYLNRNRDTCTCKFRPNNTWY